jgi:hypothetical protein
VAQGGRPAPDVQVGYWRDGSFYLNKSDMTPLSLITITQDRMLLEKIREFLLKQLDEHSCILGSSTKLIFINDKKRIGSNKPISGVF